MNPPPKYPHNYVRADMPDRMGQPFICRCGRGGLAEGVRGSGCAAAMRERIATLEEESEQAHNMMRHYRTLLLHVGEALDGGSSPVDRLPELVGALGQMYAEERERRDEARARIATLERQIEEDGRTSERLRRAYAIELGIDDPEDSPACWDEIVDVAREARARIAALESAASAVVTEWAMIEGPDHCPHCGGEDRHNEDDDDPCPVGVLQGLLHPKARTVTPSLGIFHAPRPPGADPLPTMRLRVESQTQSLVPEAEAALSRLRAAPPVDASWAGRMADVLVAGVEGPAETGDCRTCAHGSMCPFLQRSDVRAWVIDHTKDDGRTRLPNSPSCPGHKEK